MTIFVGKTKQKRKKGGSITSDSTSTSSRLSATYLEELLDQLKYEGNRKSTRGTYYNVWKNFNKFLIRLDRMPKYWEDRLSLYCTYLITMKGLQSATVKSYVSGIKYILITDGYDWDNGKMLLNTITKSCKMKNDRLKVRLPIQKGLLELILFKIQRRYNTQPYLEALYISAYLLQYYGLLRIGEIADSAHSIKAINLHEAIPQKRLLIVLYTSKTHGLESAPQKVKILGNKTIEITDSDTTRTFNMHTRDLGKFCPVEWTRRYIRLRPKIYNDTENLYILSDGSPLKACFMRSLLREILNDFNLDGQMYDTHSFRIGRATDLFKSGVSIEDIKQLGRWKSNAVYNYIKNF